MRRRDRWQAGRDRRPRDFGKRRHGGRGRPALRSSAARNHHQASRRAACRHAAVFSAQYGEDCVRASAGENRRGLPGGLHDGGPAAFQPEEDRSRRLLRRAHSATLRRDRRRAGEERVDGQIRKQIPSRRPEGSNLRGPGRPDGEARRRHRGQLRAAVRVQVDQAAQRSVPVAAYTGYYAPACGWATVWSLSGAHYQYLCF